MLGFKVRDRKLDAISGVPMFAGCNPQELAFLGSYMDEIDVPAGEILTRQGQPGHTFYVILEGNAVVEIDGREQARLGAGDFFGEISMLDRGPATATVTTSATSSLLLMSHDQFRNAVHVNEAISMRVLEAMSGRLAENEAAGFRSDRPGRPRRA
jgi:CRP-like cAMP-binding protein